MSDNETAGPAGRLGRVLVAMTAFWAVVVFYVVHTALPSNALRLPGQEQLRQSILSVVPQGWAFFTKSPRDPQIGVWRVDASGAWHDARLGPHSKPANVLGFNRRSRAQGVELGIMQTAARNTWTRCDRGDIPACLRTTPTALTLRNPSPDPILCGTVGMSLQEPVPWAWAADGSTRMPAKVTRVEITC
ncbi:SdpA family antimicrobial peptide system protein [Streptosporangium fragile]|uniref:SdpA family antimicrobial peptide system protein n=1 Tax=Streptosporangium fragile TaxID=46186 RepID=A0ABP6IJM4_9ACTN